MLHQIVDTNNYMILYYLLTSPSINVNICTKEVYRQSKGGETPLHCAVEKIKEDYVEILLAFGADRRFNGGYNVNGNIAVQRDPNGAYTFESVNQDYIGDDVDPNSIESLWHPVLEDIGSRLGEPPVVKSYK